MTRLLVTAMVLAFFLWLFGANGAALWVLDASLAIVKWVIILGVVAFLGYFLISSLGNKK